MESNVFIAMGTNVGDRELNLLRGIAEIGKLHGTRVTALSSFYDTDPVGMETAENFLNAVIRIESGLTPEKLLEELMRIESTVFGRERSGKVDSRRLDLDIIFFGDMTIDSPPKLVVPHPRLHVRRFVLEPLAEVASEFIHPVLGKSVTGLLANLKDKSRVTRV